MAKDLSPADDLLFKLIFGSQHSKRVLKHLLNSILAPTGTPIEEIEIENTEIVPEIFNGRGVRLDVRAKAEDGRLCDIEIQKANEGDMWERSMYYWASLCSRHLDKSQGFGLLKKTICINLLEFDITKNGENKDKFWSIYHVTEDSTGERYGKDLFEIHFLEMKKVHGVQKDCPITWWIEFLNNPLSDNIKEIVKFEPIIGEAVDMFNTVSK
ncbi:MAG: Rpn family recombination-promoting nuclease/putative transposase, partial [Holosporales bacterium]|nr:Rpn family recombination-promoting nuclease/putative transposase [Holosporales bacterium]